MQVEFFTLACRMHFAARYEKIKNLLAKHRAGGTVLTVRTPTICIRRVCHSATPDRVAQFVRLLARKSLCFQIERPARARSYCHRSMLSSLEGGAMIARSGATMHACFVQFISSPPLINQGSSFFLKASVASGATVEGDETQKRNQLVSF